MLKGQVRVHLLQPGALVFQLLQPPQLRDLHPRVLLLPVDGMDCSSEILYLRQVVATFAPASTSLKIRAICSSENFDFYT